MSRFDVEPTPLDGLRLLTRRPIADTRGFFERVFCTEELGGVLAGRAVVQVNRTLSASAGTVRGMHFQRPPHAEMKLVSCLRGRVFDVAVDLRSGSPTYLRWHGVELSGDNHRTLAIPEGFAHGFQTLTDDCELLYFHTSGYCRAAEGGVSPLDPALGIGWPMPIGEMSQRDAARPPMSAANAGIEL